MSRRLRLFLLILSLCFAGMALPVCAATLNTTKVTIAAGMTTQLKVSGASQKVTWSTSKKSVATVSKSGVVKGVKGGTARITAKVGKQKLVCTVTVKMPALNQKKLTLVAGSSYQLKLNNASGSITWKSSKNAVATVNKNGVVTAVKKGSTKITAKLGSKSYACTVTVKEVPAISVRTLSITTGQTYQVKMTGTSAKAAWSSSASAVATVSSTGLVRAVRAGSCSITAKVSGKNYVCAVTVKAPVTTTKTTTQTQANSGTKVTNKSAPATTPTSTDNPFAAGFSNGMSEEEKAVLGKLLAFRDNIPTDIQDRMSPKKNYSGFKEGMRYTNEDYYPWYGGTFRGGYGCAGFAFMLSDVAFRKQTSGGEYEYPIAKRCAMSEYQSGSRTFKAGDILRTDYNTHSVIVLKVVKSGSYVIVAEGNYNSSIHWGRKISFSELWKSGSYVMTRYEESTKQAMRNLRKILATLPVLRDDK